MIGIAQRSNFAGAKSRSAYSIISISPSSNAAGAAAANVSAATIVSAVGAPLLAFLAAPQ